MPLDSGARTGQHGTRSVGRSVGSGSSVSDDGQRWCSMRQEAAVGSAITSIICLQNVCMCARERETGRRTHGGRRERAAQALPLSLSFAFLSPHFPVILSEQAFRACKRALFPLSLSLSLLLAVPLLRLSRRRRRRCRLASRSPSLSPAAAAVAAADAAPGSWLLLRSEGQAESSLSLSGLTFDPNPISLLLPLACRCCNPFVWRRTSLKRQKRNKQGTHAFHALPSVRLFRLHMHTQASE